MPCQVLATPLSEAEIGARKFYDRWIGEFGLFSFKDGSFSVSAGQSIQDRSSARLD
jgi:hypothetical protein